MKYELRRFFNYADLELLNFKLQPMNAERTNILIADVIGRLSSQLNKQLEDYMIEGLKRKVCSMSILNRMVLSRITTNGLA